MHYENAVLQPHSRQHSSHCPRRYSRILPSSNDDDRQYTLCLLQWLAFSIRTISTDDAVEVLATDADGEHLLTHKARKSTRCRVIDINNGFLVVTVM